MRKPLSICLFSVLTVGMSAQVTHLVGSGGFAEVDEALAIAVPGDIVHVLPGNYELFDVNVGVTIRGIGSVVVGDFGGTGSVTVAPPAGQRVHLANLTFRERMFVPSGRVSLDECVIWAAAFVAGDACLHVSDAAVHLQASECRTGLGTTGSAMVASNSVITAIDTLFLSVTAGISTPPATVILDGSQLHACECVIQCETFLASLSNSLRAENGSTAWLSDCEMFAQFGLSCGIESDASTVRMSRTGLFRGIPCTGSAPGGTLLGVSRSGPLQTGANFALQFRADPNAFVVVFAGPLLGTVNFGPVLEQSSWLDHQTSFSVALLLADGNGDASVSWPIPSGPGIADQRLWFEGISGPDLPLQVSPVVGGIAR